VTPITIRPVNGGWIIEHNGVEHVATNADGVTEAIRQLSPYVGGGRPTQDDDAVKGEDEAWAAWSNGYGVVVWTLQSESNRTNFRAALRIAITANQTQKPMHFTCHDIYEMAQMNGDFHAKYLRHMGATVEWPNGKIQ